MKITIWARQNPLSILLILYLHEMTGRFSHYFQALLGAPFYFQN